MRKLGLAVVVSLLAFGLAPRSGSAQSYEAPERANPKDVYCSGFVAASPLPADLRIVMGEDAVGRIVYSQYDYIYLSHGRNGGVNVGQRYMVVRPVNEPNPVQAFQNQRAMWKTLGQYYLDIGWVEVTSVHETTSTALVTHACEPLNAGDVLVPFQERPSPAYKASEKFDRFAPPSGKTEGTIVYGKEFQSLLGQGDVMFINLGSGQGIKVGDYFRVYRWASGVKYEGYKRMGAGTMRRQRGIPTGYEIPKMRKDLPREVVGEAFVVRVDANCSVAVVTLSLREMHAGDYVELE